MLSGCRIDVEASGLRKKLEDLNASQKPSNEGLEQVSEKTTMATIEVSLVIGMTCFCLPFFPCYAKYF